MRKPVTGHLVYFSIVQTQTNEYWKHLQTAREKIHLITFQRSPKPCLYSKSFNNSSEFAFNWTWSASTFHTFPGIRTDIWYISMDGYSESGWEKNVCTHKPLKSLNIPKFNVYVWLWVFGCWNSSFTNDFSNGFIVTLSTVPVFSEAALLAPAAVPESEWDCDELPAASSLLDACNQLRYVKTLHGASRFTFLHSSVWLNPGKQLVEVANVLTCVGVFFANIKYFLLSKKLT